jgi:uridine kinase
LTGPSGSGKTACIDVLCRELGASVLEYENAYNDKNEWDREKRDTNDMNQTSLSKHFQEFIQNASKQSALEFTDLDLSKSSEPARIERSRKIILVEDHPNILSKATQDIVHSTLRVLCSTSSVPLVVILSDVNLEDKDSISMRNYFPSDIMHRVHEIKFVLTLDCDR